MSKLSFVRIVSDNSHLHDLAQEGDKNKTLYKGEIKKMNIDTPTLKSAISQGIVEKLSDKEADEILKVEAKPEEKTEGEELTGGTEDPKTPKTPKK